MELGDVPQPHFSLREMTSQTEPFKEKLILAVSFIFRAWFCSRSKTVQEVPAFFLLACTITLFIFTPFPVAANGIMDLDFGKDGLSATIEESSLKAVVEKIAEKEDIWIKGAEKLSKETYTVEFEDVSIREAVERMLSPFNCCYFLDQEGDLLGVIIVSKKHRRSQPQRIRRTKSSHRNIRTRSTRRARNR